MPRPKGTTQRVPTSRISRGTGASSAARGGVGLPPEGIDTSLGREAYIRAVEVAKDAIAAGEAIQVVLARRQSIDMPSLADGRPLDGIALYRALRRVNPSPYLFFVRTPAFEVVSATDPDPVLPAASMIATALTVNV